MKQKRSASIRRRFSARPVYAVAPDLIDKPGDRYIAHEDLDAPESPPKPLGLPTEPPVFRPLKVYAFDPSLGRVPWNVMTIRVRYEKLRPGPVGERVAVIDYDSSRDCFYDPVDLDDPLIAIRGGLEPSESDPHFHQQMAYAVTSETLRRVEAALGRTVCRFTADGFVPLRIKVYPHAIRDANAYPSPDGSLLLGYFRASESATGRTMPGQVVFNCLSHDVIVHTAVRSIMDSIRRDLTMDEEGSQDVLALYLGVSDVAALLLHFSYREAVIDTIQRTAGSIHRTTLEASGNVADESARIQTEISAGNPLLVLGQGFGEATGKTGGLRSALGRKPDPQDFDRLTEPHERGSILVAAIFDSFFSVYIQRSLDLFRIYRAGGGRLDTGDVPAPLAERLFEEASNIAARMFDTIVRALDYCPPFNLTFGDFLRACITADYEYAPVDEWGIRDALMQAFRRRGIKPQGVPFFSEEALRWPIVGPGDFKESRLVFQGMPEPDESSRQQNQDALRAFVKRNARELGTGRARVQISPLEVSRIPTPANELRVVLCATVGKSGHARGRKGRGIGARLVFDRSGRLRYAIKTTPLQTGASDKA